MRQSCDTLREHSIPDGCDMSEERHADRGDPPLRSVRFAAFELDVRTGELRKHGVRIRLQEQPFQVLLMPVERPGEVVFREEIRKRLWPNDTIVEFAPSINTAIQRLRDALGDSADSPRYVETVARRGYRFIGELVLDREDQDGPVREPPQENASPALASADISSPDIRDLSARTISHYRVFEKLGSGGMGEVYRARDTKLGRDVALKVLPEEIAHDADRMARFEREAQILASLNHPNVAAIYGLEESSGIRALAMELVEGPTLAERIARGAIPLEEALEISQQIADALQAAHEKGIVHRDLKPANVKVTPQGLVKVLDFGLATVVRGAGHVDDPEDSAALASTLSRTGVMLGTAAYMSPEQARGQAVDKRADIWAFGVVLYEMLTGKRLFAGETITDTLSAVLTKEPEWGRVPAHAQRLLRYCLEKDPNQRLRDIGDAQFLLEGAPVESVTAPRGILPWAVAAILALIAVAALWAPWRKTRPVEQPLVRLDVGLGSDVSLAAPDNYGSSVIISPDGTRLVYKGSVSGGPPKLFSRRLDQAKAIELPGTEGALGPFFSPDGQWVGFGIGNKVCKVSVEGGAVIPLSEVVPFGGARWGEGGNIIVEQIAKGLVRISSDGSAPTPVTELASGELTHLDPQILPGGKAVLFVAVPLSNDIDKDSIEIVTLADRRRKTLFHGGTSPRYLPSGHVVYATRGTLYAIPFNLDRLETRGTAVPVVNDVNAAYLELDAEFDVSRSGTLVYRRRRSGGPGMLNIQLFDGAGRKESQRPKPGVYSQPRFSADGKRLALQVAEGAIQDVWVYEWQRDTMMRVTFSGSPHFGLTWSPDGRYVVSGSHGSGMFWTRADGAGQAHSLTQSKNFQTPWSFTPDGKRLAYVERYAASGPPGLHIWTVPVEDNGGELRVGKPELFLQTQFSERYPAFSPDGRWLAYQSNESGKDEVYVRAFPPPASGPGGRWQISNSGGKIPIWLRNSRELLYRAGDQIMAVSYVVKGDSFVVDKPRVRVAKLGGAEFDLAPDGTRLAVITPVGTPEAEHEIVFLLNFFDELRRRAPTGN
jgi:serine/threonine protein kinase/Tol biopolymer transport system component